MRKSSHKKQWLFTLVMVTGTALILWQLRPWLLSKELNGCKEVPAYVSRVDTTAFGSTLYVILDSLELPAGDVTGNESFYTFGERISVCYKPGATHADAFYGPHEIRYTKSGIFRETIPAAVIILGAAMIGAGLLGSIVSIIQHFR